MSRPLATPPADRLRQAAGSAPVVLFLCMFAAQSALLVLSPILPGMAADLGVSTSTAAQLRAVSGVVAGGVAVWTGMWAKRRDLRVMLAAGLALLAVGTLTSAAAPSFGVLAAAQVGVGAGLALVLSNALTAAGEWTPERRSRTLSWALIGQPVAWIVGMPVAGAVAETSWRYAWLVVPFAASLVALLALAFRAHEQAAPAARSDEPSLWRHQGAKGWAAGELLAYGGWAGTLIFAGALFVETYGASTTAVGLLLALAAGAYLPGNFLARRWVDRRARTLLIAGASVSSLGVVVFGGVRPGMAWSAVLLAALAFVAGARTIAGSAAGLDIAPKCKLQAMSVRTAAVQYGYLLGASLGGAALAGGGYGALGLALGALYLAGAMPHLWAWRARRTHGHAGVTAGAAG